MTATTDSSGGADERSGDARKAERNEDLHCAGDDRYGARGASGRRCCPGAAGMRNGERDTLIDCGPGADIAVVDRIDPEPIACERVRRRGR